MKKNFFKRHIIWLIVAAWVYTFTLIFNNYWSKYASYQSVTSSFQKSVTQREQRFENWVKDTAYLEALSAGNTTTGILSEVKQLPFYVFLYHASDTSGVPIFWSTNSVLPDAYHVSFYPNGSFVKLGNGQYELLKRRVILNHKNFIVIGLVQLHEEFFIQSGVLRKEYPGFKGLGDKMELTQTTTSFPIIGANGKSLIYFLPKVPEPIYVFNWLSFITQCIATILFLVSLTRLANDIIRKQFIAGLISFFLFFMLFWVAVEHYGVPIDFSRFPLFSDENILNKTESGQLRSYMLYALFGLWITVFLTMQTPGITNYLNKLKKFSKWSVLVVLCLSVSAAHILLIYLVRNLYLNSTIGFDFTNFFSLNFSKLLSFLILFLLIVSHYLLLRFAVLCFRQLSVANTWIILSIIALSVLIFLSVFPGTSLVFSVLFALVWLLVFFVVTYKRIINPELPSSGMIVAWLFVYSLSVSLFLGLLSETRLKNRTNDIAASLLLQRDETSEKLVKIAALNVKRIDWISLMRTGTSETLMGEKKDSLAEEYFGGYLQRFNTNIYIFDRNRLGVFNHSDVSYESLNTMYETQATLIDPVDNLAYFGESFDRFGYIIRREVRNAENSNLEGYVFVMVRSVNPTAKAFSPELFRQLQNFAINLPKDFSYAWYKNGTLTEQFRNYPFQTNLPPEMIGNRSRWEHKTKDAYELWLNAGSNNVLVIAAQRNVLINIISMVAYLFGAFLVFYFIIFVIAALTKGSINNDLFEKINLNLQTKIRLTVVAILTISFIIVAVVTISFFIRQFKSDNTEKLAQTIQAVSSDLARKLPDNYDSLSYIEKKTALQNVLYEITRNQNIDVNCFDSSGTVIASTQNVLYDKEVISPMVDPLVWWNLTKGEVHRYISNENIGNLSFSSIYQPMLDKQNKVIFYLQVPFFASQSELSREISNFLVILINIIAFVFLLSGSIAYWISGSITRSFNLIAEKMDRIRLSEHNERIDWAPKDEIGNLVFQYNKMVDQLEDSVKKMARTEREMAWREMAKQVAHEIKNPLTPMKLSLQFLQKAIKENDGDVAQITEKVASNLVGQIDHLSKIATEFSKFANLGTYKPELFNLQDTLREVIQIYEMQEHVSIKWHPVNQPLYLSADKTQINRLITNLLQNASESGDKNKIIRIEIGERLIPGSVVISVADNGQGIPDPVKNNIFMPNFTTKTSGTGLGLSICKAIVENASGAIWFETESGVGTTFYVRLPLANK